MAAADHPSVETILSGAGVRFAGSRASGRAQDSSDADVAVMPSRPLGLLERERLALRLARAFGVPDVDLVSLDTANLELRGRVVQDGRPIYTVDETLSELRAAEYQGDRAFAGRYLVQVSAQVCIDMANHVIASSGWRTPAD